MWQNSKNLNVTKLKNSKFDKTENSNMKKKKLRKTKYVTKLFLKEIVTNLTILNSDKTHKLKLWEKKLKSSSCHKTKKKLIIKKLKNLNCNKTQKLEMGQNLT